MKSEYLIYVIKRLVLFAILFGGGIWVYINYFASMQKMDLDELFVIYADAESARSKAAEYEVLNRAKDMDSSTFIIYAEDDSFKFRSLAASAIGETRDQEAIPLLVELLSDDDLDVRISAARACKSHGSNELIKPLIDQLTQVEDTNLKNIIAGALQKLTGENYSANLSKWQLWYSLNKNRLSLE